MRIILFFYEKKNENILHIEIELRKVCPIRAKCVSFFLFFSMKKLNEIYFCNKIKFTENVSCDISNEKKRMKIIF